MNALNKFDLKQIRLIEKKIDLFKNNNINLFTLVCDLNSLLNALENVPNYWKSDFQSEINTLELINDSIEDGSISRWNGNFKEDMNKSVSKLKNMAFSIINDYFKTPDSNILEIAIEASSDWLICPKCNDAWKSHSRHAMVDCPKCNNIMHNPHYTQIK